MVKAIKKRKIYLFEKLRLTQDNHQSKYKQRDKDG